MGTELEYAAPRRVRDVVESLGRTEDVRFSPNGRRLGVACFLGNRVVVFDIAITATDNHPHIELSNCVELSSPALNYPHGMDFIDDETLIVANRGGDVAILAIPAAGDDSRSPDLLPVQTWPNGGNLLLESPGSIAVVNAGPDAREILICNNSGNTVTRHLLASDGGYVSQRNEVLLRRWLDIPDGVCVSHDGRWIAVSNHNAHSVFVYERTPTLNEHSNPDGILRGVHYPHGLRFSADGQHLFVADAGAPHVHVYAADGAGWYGVRHPANNVRILDEPVFLRGRHNPEEGGAKGLDLDRGGRVLVITCEYQPLAFFEVPAMLQSVSADWAAQRESRILDVDYELSRIEEHARMKTRARTAEDATNAMRQSRSWRLTAPLRSLVHRMSGR